MAIANMAGAVGEVDSKRLADVMRAFGNPVRIEILRQLKQPRALGEIRVHPNRRGAGRSERFVSRATVRHHVTQLVAIGAVRTRSIMRDSQSIDHYVLSHQQMFALAEELHQMARIRPAAQALDQTVVAAPGPQAIRDPSPKLVLANGLHEGSAFALREGPAAGWSIGRRVGSSICLDYDPYVSLDHARITRTTNSFHVSDMPSARNRTEVNWEPLAAGDTVRLQSGDVIGVGRSRLLFRDH